AIVVSSGVLGGQDLPGRVLVLLTDGHDVRSLSSFADALRTARANNVVVYAIGLGNADRAPLKQLAHATGGQFYPAPTPAALKGIYTRIAGELNHTWRISYTTAARPGDTIRVTLNGAASPGRSVTLPGSSSAGNGGFLPHSFVSGAAGTLLFLL